VLEFSQWKECSVLNWTISADRKDDHGNLNPSGNKNLSGNSMGIGWKLNQPLKLASELEQSAYEWK